MTHNNNMENGQKSTRSSKRKKHKNKEEEDRKRLEEKRQRDAKREEDRRLKEQRKKEETERRVRELKQKAEEGRRAKEQRKFEEEQRKIRSSLRRAAAKAAGRKTSEAPPCDPTPAAVSQQPQRAPAFTPGPGSLQRSASFIRRAIEEIGEKVLRRSLSFAGDLNRPASTGRGDSRRSQWAASLSSLQEDGPIVMPNGTAPSASATDEVDGDVVLRRGSSLPRGMRPPGLEGFGAVVARSQSLLICDRPMPASDDQGLSSFPRKRLGSHSGTTSAATTPSPLQETQGRSGAASLGSLPWLHKFPHEEHVLEHPRYRRQSSIDVSRRSTKIRRQEAIKKDRGTISGRSRSLTHIDALDGPVGGAGNMLVKGQDMDSRSEPDTTHDRLIVPPQEPPQVRRQKLARSQVSSSEYFSVSFEVGEPHEEFVPADKGVTLADALSDLCTKRGVDLTTAQVYIDSNVKAPCQCLNTDVSLLGGKHVRVRAKDDKSPVRGLSKPNQLQNRKSAGSYRGKGSRGFFSASTEDPGYTGDSSHEGSFKGTKSSKQRWSGLFGNTKDTKMESLIEHLNSYTKQGIPPIHSSNSAAEHLDERIFELENDWKDIVTNPSLLPERQMHQQTALWELVQTELAYIRTLKVVTDLFLACLRNLQASNILNEIDTSRLFSNITNIYSANCIFWADAILPMLRIARDFRKPLDPSLMLDGFLKFDDVFHPYQKYCGEQLQCQLYCREKHQENEMFTAYLAWCETQKDCNRLRLMDILVKPMQRLTKYSLLLKAVQKNTQLEEQRTNLERMIRCVDEFVHNVNTNMRQREDHERLRGIIARIESYDVVDSKDDELEKLLRSYSVLDLTSPMPGCHVTQRRYLLFESDLKFRDNTTSKMDVHCFLLTDMLLVCKAATKRGGGEGRMRVVRQPFVVERLMVHELGRDPPGLGVVYLNEYRTATAAFILTSGDSQLIKAWAEHIRKAQDLYATAKIASLITSIPPTQVVTRQPSALWNDEDGEEVEVVETDVQSCASLNMAGVASRSPRGGSSRCSRVSSLAHSHSGSVDMNEVSSVSSVSHSRGVSVENELRGSSLSSDEGIPGLPSVSGGADPKQPQPSAPSASPRSDRRSILCKSPTPNTLSVQVPVYSSLGQSLPNLSLATSPSSGGHSSHPNPPTSLLLVPPSTSKSHHHHGGLLSPGHRGVSYPPPSPPRGSLRRGLALSQSRNPPLIKTRHINSCSTSVVGSAIPVAPLLSPTHSMGATTASFDFDVPVIAGVSPPSEECPTPEPPEMNSRSHRHPVMKRLARTENRRYHTAGAIDDLKKQNSKDTSIHKRLSWNCGHGQHHGQSCSSGPPDPSGKCVSIESVHSSSGVSSTGSVQFGSLASGLEEFGSLDLEGSALQVVCENPSTCCCDTSSTHHIFSPSPSTEAVNMELLKTQISPSPTHLGGIVQTTALSGTTSHIDENTTTLPSDGSRPPSREEVLRIKDLMLSDTSLEASHV